MGRMEDQLPPLPDRKPKVALGEILGPLQPGDESLRAGIKKEFPFHTISSHGLKVKAPKLGENAQLVSVDSLWRPYWLASI
jgi:hypothetical protein